jgi:alkylation response protein AidB-like acyl-CoA dehydrogenase
MTTTMELRQDLLEKVDKVAPLIREHALEAERQRRLPQPVSDALRDAGFFRMFRPRSLGGLEADPVTAYCVIEALARIDSAAGWNVGISNATEPFGAWLPEAACKEIFGAPDAVMAGAFNPPRKAVPVDGGYRLSGKTPFNSNCHSATWFSGLAHVYDGKKMRLDDAGQPTTLLTFVPAREATIIENWETLGLGGTGSHDVQVDDIFVPNERAVPFVPLEQLTAAYSGPSYRLTVWPPIACNAVPALGIAQAAIDDLVELSRKVPAYTTSTLRDRPVVQQQLARAEGKLSAARVFFHSAFDDAWKVAVDGRFLEMADRARCQLAASHAVLAAAEAVDLVHACAGSSGIRNEHRFQKHFRDVHVITQHAFVSAARLESVGQIMMGLEPDWPFFAF